MANTLKGAQLTEAHRQMQIALRAMLLKDLVTVWKAFDIRNIDVSYANIEEAILAIIERLRTNSFAVASRYAELFRIAERVPGRLPPPPLPDASTWRPPAVVSLRVTGPSAAKIALAAAKPPEVASQVALVRLSGAATRITLNGGRDALTTIVQSDRRSLGWARVTDGDPCFFCAMLASRGPVYKSESSADFEAHDHDACMIEPVYFTSSKWPGRGREFREMWEEATKNVKGEKEAQKAFRDRYERR